MSSYWIPGGFSSHIEIPSETRVGLRGENLRTSGQSQLVGQWLHHNGPVNHRAMGPKPPFLGTQQPELPYRAHFGWTMSRSTRRSRTRDLGHANVVPNTKGLAGVLPGQGHDS